jgi:hypothetical protein
VTTGEIRQQTYRGLWNLAGRNAKQKNLKQMQILLNNKAFDLVTSLSYEGLSKDQDIVTGIASASHLISSHLISSLFFSFSFSSFSFSFILNTLTHNSF